MSARHATGPGPRWSFIAALIVGIFQTGFSAIVAMDLRAVITHRPPLSTWGDVAWMAVIILPGAWLATNAMYGAQANGDRKDRERAEAKAADDEATS